MRMKWIQTIVVATVLATAGFAVGYRLACYRTSTASAQRAAGELAPAKAQSVPPLPADAMVTLAELRVSPSIIGLQAHLARLDAQCLRELLITLNDIGRTRRNPWEWTMYNNAFHELKKRDPELALTHIIDSSENQWLAQHETGELFSELGITDPNKAKELLANIDDEVLRTAAIENLAHSWAATEPQLAIAWLRENVSKEAFEKKLPHLLESWGRSEPLAALEAIRADPAIQQHDILVRSVISSWVANDTAAAFSWLKSQDDSQLWDKAWLEADYLAEKLGDHTFELLELHPPSSDDIKQSAWAAAIAEAYSKDPDRVLTRYANADEELRRSMLPGLAISLAEKDPSSAAAMLDAGPKGRSRQNEIGTVLGHFIGLEPAAAALWWQTLPDDERTSLSLSGDFQRSAQFANALTDPTRHLQVFEQLASSWSERDPTAALAWAQSLPAGTLRSAATTKVLRQAALADPASALVSASSLDDLALRGRFVAEAAGAWAMTDPGGAIDAALNLVGTNQIRALDAALQSAIERQPARLAALLTDRPELLAASADPTATTVQLAAEWARRDLPGAIEWAQSLPEGQARDASLASASTELARHDPDAAREILDELPASQGRDDAYRRTAASLLSIDPAAAFSWASEISDPTGRANELERIAARWSLLDPVAAQLALSQQQK